MSAKRENRFKDAKQFREKNWWLWGEINSSSILETEIFIEQFENYLYYYIKQRWPPISKGFLICFFLPQIFSVTYFPRIISRDKYMKCKSLLSPAHFNILKLEAFLFYNNLLFISSNLKISLAFRTYICMISLHCAFYKQFPYVKYFYWGDFTLFFQKSIMCIQAMRARICESWLFELRFYCILLL